MFDWIIYFGRWFFNGIKNLFHFFSVVWNYDNTINSKLQFMYLLTNSPNLNELLKVLNDDCFYKVYKEIGLWDIRINGDVDFNLLKSDAYRYQKLVECRKQNFRLIQYYLSLFILDLSKQIEDEYSLWRDEKSYTKK